MAQRLISYGKSFRSRLLPSFAGGAFILLLAGGFALYLMNQLGTAVEQAISDVLPKTTAALRLSEHSALLVASVPNLMTATEVDQTHGIALALDRLKAEIDRNLSILEEAISDSHRLARVRQRVASLANILERLKLATIERIALNARQSEALARIHAVHDELVDTLSPLVWGASSLTRLQGKRASRANVSAIKALRDRSLATLLMLHELQVSHAALTASTHGRSERNGNSAFVLWKRALEHLQTEDYQTEPAYRQLVEIGTELLPQRLADAGARNAFVEAELETALAQAVARSEARLAQQLSELVVATDSSIAEFAEKTVRDMGYALDIKAEGNLLFALLTSVAEASRQERVSNLEDRFKRSRVAFQRSATDFQSSSLSLRNPILAGNVQEIEKRLRALGEGPDSLFEIRRSQLAASQRASELLASNRAVAAQLKQEVEELVQDVKANATALQLQLGKSRGANRVLLILVFLIGLVLLALIAWFSVRILEKQDRDIRQAATVFESTGEGVIITNSQSRIIAVNKAFSQSSGYVQDEIVGHHIRVLRSRRHDKAFYRDMRQTLAEDGRWQGEIYTRNKNGSSDLDWLTVNVVRDNQGDVIQHVAVFSDVAIVKRSLKKLDHLAHHDILTGLPNRLLLRDRLDHAIRRAWREQRHLGVIYLDLDRFKNINDTLGHTAGDELLRVVSKRLSDQVRDGDTVARLGGDEFMVLLEDYRSPHDARAVAQKVLDSFRKPFLIESQELFVTASIGISVYPGDGMSVDELISNSDAAMYRAKEQGKDNYQFYTSDLTIAAREKLRLESSLRLALEREQFMLHYQPKWNTSTGTITGVEALLRWQHPEYGLVGPAGFLGALEDCGLILPVGRWIMSSACRQAQAWQQLGLPAIQMAINISGRQIAQGDLLKVVEASLTESGLDPRHLELEITEGFLMKQPDEVIALLQVLREWGVSIAIDDFGTGYSSLSYLKQLPIQKLKIDRSFIKDIPDDPDDVAIASAIIALGLRLQMSIVAEGVETEEQLAFLKREGCNEAQGYLFSKPIPPAELTTLLRRNYAFTSKKATRANI